jgi:hypothetical protein
MEVTVTLADNIYRSFSQLAAKTNRSVDDVIAEKIQTDYWIEDDAGRELADLSDAEILELANLKLSRTQDRRMSQLLENQRESRITTGEKIELEGLMGLYHLSNLRKAQGILEAVKRGLLKTPEDLK